MEGTAYEQVWESDDGDREEVVRECRACAWRHARGRLTTKGVMVLWFRINGGGQT